MDFCYNLINGVSWSRKGNNTFSILVFLVKKNSRYLFAKNFHGRQIFGNTGFEKFFCRNFLRTSVATLLMASIGPGGQTGAFSSSNKPQSRKNKSLLIFMCYSPWIFGDKRF
ncbi:hypothetical protein H5410_056099 [Solanum commersonii]|uniref:Uncharacterized protein n=1 Tax=Solanum commersonii TaxID=4109 RepID=A0A9J5WKQ2_SOLCO|nr:hypothetical protein H5410_056099 [Solanum commersonii]